MFSKLIGLQYRILYRPGSSNHAADALSRHPAPPALCAMVSVMVPSWVSTVVDSYKDDAPATSLMTKLALDLSAVPHFTLHSGLLRYHNWVWVGSDPQLQNQLIAQFHSSAWGGHSDILVMCRRLKQCFDWRGVAAAVQEFVQHGGGSSGVRASLSSLSAVQA